MNRPAGDEAGATANPELAPRIARLRRELIKAIPRIPNDRTSLQHMEQKHLGDLLIDYFSWRSRYVGVRPRAVTIAPGAAAASLWAAHRPGIDALLDKVQRGDDLTAHVSLQPHREGYAPAARADPAERWADKDFLLNASNLHHFHLGARTEAKGHIERTDALLFAEIDRATFRAIGVFDHRVFERGSPENLRFLEARDAARPPAPPDMVVIETLLATSGHPVHVVTHAVRCTRLVRQLDARLDDSSTLATLYRDAGWPVPEKTRPEWMLRHLDLALLDRANDRGFVLAEGWN